MVRTYYSHYGTCTNLAEPRCVMRDASLFFFFFFSGGSGSARKRDPGTAVLRQPNPSHNQLLGQYPLDGVGFFPFFLSFMSVGGWWFKLVVWLCCCACMIYR